MNIEDFSFNLPKELIAQFPLPERSASRLLHLHTTTGKIQHKNFKDLLDCISQNDLVVFNNTKVIPARILGTKQTGGKVEILVERILDDQTFLAQMRSSKKLKPGSEITVDASQNIGFIVKEKQGCFHVLQTRNNASVIKILEEIGQLPLPPYIEHQPSPTDYERYQTIFAKHQGAVAAPTAGLHFDQMMFDELAKRKIATTFITLHVGAGTFQPLRVTKIEEHQMHREHFVISEETANKINQTKKNGGKIFAVGTTTVRALESAAQQHQVIPFAGETNIFIYPGFKFQITDALLTNFHLPKSSLLLLVSAFASKENILRAYQEAIDRCYRFFSYGDAMLITQT
jgi:S-adenosylmethionine:tRNA ribosyltransferase-isomerase